MITAILAMLALLLPFHALDLHAQTLIVANAGSNRALLLDPFSGATLASVATGPGPHEIAVSVDGRFAYLANAGGPSVARTTTISVIDVPARRLHATFDMGDACNKPHDLRVSRDGALLWVACAEARAVVEVDARTGRVLESWPVQRDGAWMLAVAPDARKIVTANLEGSSISILDRSARTTRVIPRGGAQLGLEITPDGRTAWSSSAVTGADSVFVFDLTADTLLAAFGTHGNEPVRIRFLPDGRTAVLSNEGSRTLTLYDVAQRRAQASIHLPHAPKVLSLSHDGCWAAVSHPANSSVSIVNLAARQLARTLAVGGTPDGVAWVPLPAPAGLPGDQDPAWSPDGTRLVFTSERSGDREIYVMPVDGGEATRLTHVQGRDAHPAFSPDGRWIAFQSPRDGSRAELYLMPASGGAARRLTTLGTFSGALSWAPDSRRIAFQALIPGADGREWWQVFMLDSLGATPRQLTRAAAHHQVPRWSRAGERLVIYADLTGSNELYTMNPESGALQRITYNEFDETPAAWLPDGRLVFVSERFGARGLYVMASDGTGERLLYAGNVYFGAPEPSPDGRRIAFVAMYSGRSMIHILDLEHGTVRPVHPTLR